MVLARFAIGLMGVVLFAAQATWADEAPSPQATIETSLGSITIALDRAHAPVSVANFIAYAREGHFDGTMIYRVEQGFVLQMGSTEAGGASRPTQTPIALESSNGLSNVRGAVAMARAADPASATAEFFIDLADNTRLDATPGAPPNSTGYAVFGKVTGGMDVVDRIAAVPVGGHGPFPPASTPLTPIIIEKVTVTEAPPPASAPSPTPPAPATAPPAH